MFYSPSPSSIIISSCPPFMPPSSLWQLDDCICLPSNPNANISPPAASLTSTSPATANSSTQTPTSPPILNPATANSSSQTPSLPPTITPPTTANSSSQTPSLPPTITPPTAVNSYPLTPKTFVYKWKPYFQSINNLIIILPLKI